MNQRPEPRIGDAERAAAAEALGEHYAAGRLTKEEYDERSGSVWAAKTASDLRPLFLDLPPLGPTGRTAPQPRFAAGRPRPSSGEWRPQVTQPGPRRHSGTGFRLPWLPVLLIVLGLAFLLEGPWWLILIGAFFLARSFRHGCGHGLRHSSGSDRAPRGNWS